jgi:hypothetical protein
VEELLARGVEVVVLSRGQLRRLGVAPETASLLEDRGVETHVLPTKAAARLYNELAEAGRRVGALIHTTC